jgi:Alpha/beta hydrolase family
MIALMKPESHHRRLTQFAIWLGLAIAAPAWGQTSAPSNIPAPVSNVPNPVPSSAGVAESAGSVVVRGPCDPDYWIVSSRGCEEQLECNRRCQYAVHHFDGPGRCRVGSLDEMYASMQPGVPVCFMVHGSFVDRETMLRDSAATYRWLRRAAPERPIQIVFYTWPSDDTMTLLPNAVNCRDARRLGRRAELNSLYLAELVSRVPDDRPICLIGHSHGARMVAATLHFLAGGIVQGRCFSGGPYARQRIRAVLAAAAMDHDGFNPGQRFDLALCRAEALINLKNRRDVPLWFHPAYDFFTVPALGHTGITRCDQEFLGQSSCRVIEYDVTRMIGFGHVWPHYYQQPDIACMIRDYVYFSD